MRIVIYITVYTLSFAILNISASDIIRFLKQSVSEKSQATTFSESTARMGRNWADLYVELLVLIFANVGVESLVRSLPFVCKSWYHASRQLKCWETLQFFESCSDEFVKSVVARCHGVTTQVVFHFSCPEDGLFHVSKKCPDLKILTLWDFNLNSTSTLRSDRLCMWQKLEYLHFSTIKSKNLIPILEAVGIHCKNFVGLTCSSSIISRPATAAIVDFVPKIKYLDMKYSFFNRKQFLHVLMGCKELEFLDVRHCHGYEVHLSDTVIYTATRKIRTFKF